MDYTKLSLNCACLALIMVYFTSSAMKQSTPGLDGEGQPQRRPPNSIPEESQSVKTHRPPVFETGDFDLKRGKILKFQTFGGKRSKPAPKNLTITDEVWFDLRVDNYLGDGKPYNGRITVGCFGKNTPITCLNFVTLARGFLKGRHVIRYRNSNVQKVVRDFMLQMGDVGHVGDQGSSIYGNNFADEDLSLSHNNAGWVGMANFGVDTNGSQFYVLLGKARWLDGKHVIFGKVLEGMKVLEDLSIEETDVHNRPIRDIIIVNCGVKIDHKPYLLTAKQLNTDKDIIVK